MYGSRAHDAVERARRVVGELLGTDAESIVFTAGGTESNNLAIEGVWRAHRADGGLRNHIVISAVEHPAVVEVARWLEGQSARISILPVNAHGQVDGADLEREIGSDTLLVSVMHANNEVGTLQPIAGLAAIAHRHGAWMHSDAAQSVGKVSVDVEVLGVDLLTIAGHKLYAPEGIGALYVRRGVPIAPVLHGASHERGIRPGTEPVAQIVALARAAQLVGDGGATATPRYGSPTRSVSPFAACGPMPCSRRSPRTSRQSPRRRATRMTFDSRRYYARWESRPSGASERSDSQSVDIRRPTKST